MVSESFQYGSKDPFLWQISFGSLLCLCCLVFLGLKFKRFRKQLRLGSLSTKPSKAEPVEGVGFKIKTHQDDYQSYKSISEFAIPASITQPKTFQQPNKFFTKEETRTQPLFTTETTTPNIFKKVSIKSDKTPAENNSTTVDIENTITENLNVTKETKIAIKDEGESKDEYFKQDTTTSSYDLELKKEPEKPSSPAPKLKIENPLSTFGWSNEIPTENEDEFKERFNTNRSNKSSTDNEFENLHNINLNVPSSGMYTNQAVSIFYGGQMPETDSSTPTNAAPTVKPRKFLENHDRLSMNSEAETAA